MRALIILSLMLGTLTAQSQTIEKQVIGSMGGISSGGNYSVDCTVGEIVIDTFSSGSILLYQGYHHANDSNKVTLLTEVALYASYTLYPNPTTNNSKLEITASRAAKCIVSIYSAEGKLVQSSSAELIAGVKSKIELNISNQASGIYYVRISQDNNASIKTLKLIKQ